MLVEEYTDYMRYERGLSENSIQAYLFDLKKFLSLCEIPIQKVGRKEMQEFLVTLNKQGSAAKSQARIIASLRGYFDFLRIKRIVSKNPAKMVDKPKVPEALPVILTVDETIAILDAVDVTKRNGYRDKAILETFYATGIRKTELRTLRLIDFYPEDGIIKVVGKGNKERLVPINEKAIEAIQNYIRLERPKVDEPELFLTNRKKPLKRYIVEVIVSKYVKLAGVVKKVTPHSFRHAFATHLVQGGADLRTVQDLLGHTSITTTEIYVHLDQTYLRNTIDKFFPTWT